MLMTSKDVSLKSKDVVTGISDDQYFQIKDEFQQIQSSLGMYISKGNTEGALHLEKEILNNALDECTNGNEFWNTHKKELTVSFYESERRFITSDNGRGIPLDILVDAVMRKHTSTKTIGISSSRNKKQTGLNGVGLTVSAALSDYMSITSYRGNKYKKIEIVEGTLVEHPVSKNSEYKTGTTVEIVPSEKYLGPINLTTEIVEDYLRNLSYILDKDITITFIGEKDVKGKKPKYFTRVYEPQGLSAACKYMSSSLEFSPIEIKCVSDNFDITLAFSYDRTLDDSSTASFCNYVISTEGGCHASAAMRAICNYFTREGRRQEPNSKYEIAFDDCRRGLVLAVNLEHVEPKFEGQHKTKVSNNDVISDGVKMISEALFRTMNNNQMLLKKILSYLRNISKARQESHKIKGISVKRNTTFLEDAKIEKYFTVSNRNSTGYKELYLAEGDSAAGGILNSRNPNYQAVYTVSGVTDNVYDLSLTQLLQKKTFKELIQILGTGIGKDFDINKLRYDKIIICTD
jgi:DNA gyrase subunit B